jgi:excisionase family DNA binding protein
MKFVTTSDAVRLFRMHPATVLRLIATQRVEAHKDGNGKWLVRHSDLERWNSRRLRRAPKPLQQVDSDIPEVHP